MKPNNYALVTPSYWKDVERCRLLLETSERWLPPRVRHYIVVAKRDLPLFRPMLTQRNTLIVVEDIIPRWLFRVPGLRHFWLSLRTRPVKNWILQQIVKLSIPQVVTEDVLLYADSDMFFVEPFDPVTYEKDGKVPLFCEPGQRGLIPSNDIWQAVCCKLLGIPAVTDFDNNYVGQLVWWRRSNAVGAVGRVQEIAGMSWQQAIARLSGFAEYILYGLYSERVLGAESGHWRDGIYRTQCYWRTQPLNLQELEAFKAKKEPQHHSVMISAKSGTTIADIRKVFLDGV